MLAQDKENSMDNKLFDLKKRVYESGLVKIIYKGKTYITIAAGQFGFITGKFVEIMAMIVLIEKLMGIEIIGASIAWFTIIIFVLAILTGFIFKLTGLYDVDEYVAASKHPVQTEILEAARIIKDKWGPKK